MLNCLNPELSLKVLTLQEMSGLSDFSLKSLIRHYTQLHNGRLPNLDELDGSDSRPYLLKTYNIKAKKSLKVSDLAKKVLGEKYLKTDIQTTVSDITHKLNNIFTDLILIPHIYGKNVGFEILRRPTINYSEPVDTYTPTRGNTGNVLNSILDKLNDLYGIKVNTFKPGNTKLLLELRHRTGNLNYSLGGVNGFIYNGEIYINAKLSEKDADKTKVHELLHLIVGSIKFTNPSVYNNFVGLASQYTTQFLEFVNKEFGKEVDLLTLPTLSDYQEEFIVEELAKYLSGMSNSILNTSPYNYDEKAKDLRYLVLYNMNRVLDTAFMGDYSVKSIPPANLYTMTLGDVMDVINSVYIKNSNFKNLVQLSLLHRILANKKKLLVNDNELTLKCE